MNAEQIATTTGTTDQPSQNSDGNRKLYHDLHGPVINIKGFSAEIHLTLSQLHELLKENRQSVPAELYTEMEQLILKDLFPCIGYLDNSNDMLSNRMINLISDKQGDTNKSQ